MLHGLQIIWALLLLLPWPQTVLSQGIMTDFKDETIINIRDRWVCDQHFCKDWATLPLNTILITTANS